MAVKFTKEQQLAIDTTDKSILVSAAAGSGKTAILVQRILSIILEGKANVDEMLIVTFTKAAAAEMRLRLAKAIRNRMREHPEESKRLKDQLNRLYKAYISTIDSFALRVIREFFYEIDIEPDFGACDEIQGELMRREAVNELFEEGFDNDSFISEETGFREFLRLYSEERSEEGFKADLLQAYARLRSIPDYFGWAYEKAEGLLVTKETFESSILHDAMLDDAVESLSKACEAARKVRDIMCSSGLQDLCEDKLAEEINSIEEILIELEKGRLDEPLMDRFAGIVFPALRAKKAQKESFEAVKEEVKALRDVYKKELKEWRSRYLEPDFGTRLDEMNSVYKYTIYYIKLLEAFEERYAARKKERRVMDFADMEHNAVRILGSDAAAETLRRRFRFVFVDEYQDTNNIQEYLIGKVSRPDNVFKVGDVKQSIYKFRQAEPEIFERVYKEYSDPADTDGIAIDLSKNFRSNDATIKYINRVFKHVMEGYDERAMLYTGCKCRPEYDFVPEVHILTDQDEEDDADVEQEEILSESYETAGAGGDSDSEIDDEIEDLSKEEAEAAYIADLAYRLIGTEFHDTSADVVRKAQARDIVILFRAVKVRGDIMARALRKRGIESHVEESDDYFDTVEISIALSLLTCIDNMKRDVPLIATLHSEVFGWTPEELAFVRIAHNEHMRKEREAAKKESGGPKTEPVSIRPAYWEALEWFMKEGPEDGQYSGLREKAANAFNKIMEWRRLSRMMALEDFVWKVLTDSGYYKMAGAMNGGARRQANLRVLADRAGKYSSETVSSLSSYITFLDVMRKKKISNGQASMVGSDDDVIRISTIHKSKGLEYPFVIVGGLGHDFKRDSSGKKFSFDSSIGVSLPYIDPKRRFWRSTMMQRAITAKSGRDSYNEELRILYVAMTRARNKLIMTGTCKSIEDLMKYTPRPANYLKVIRDVIKTPDNTYKILPLVRQAVSKTYSASEQWLDDTASPLTDEEERIYQEIDRRFGFEYPESELLTAKAKYSASAVRKEELERKNKELNAISQDGFEESQIITNDTEPVNLWNASESRKKASAADIGIAYHRIMEFLDLTKVLTGEGKVDLDYVTERAAFLTEHGAVDDQAMESVDLDKIAAFLGSPLGKRAVEAAKKGKLRREKPFTLKTVRSGHEMLIQGVIDCCFEEDGKMILIDYKSSFIRLGKSREAEIERIRNEYAVQIELYSEAVIKGTGLEVGEAYLYLFDIGLAIKMA